MRGEVPTLGAFCLLGSFMRLYRTQSFVFGGFFFSTPPSSIHLTLFFRPLKNRYRASKYSDPLLLCLRESDLEKKK